MSPINERKPYDDEVTPADDWLFGAAPIGKFIGKPRGWVYHKQKALGLHHIGATLVGSKQQLRKLLTQG
jgi:hypothetical protein